MISDPGGVPIQTRRWAAIGTRCEVVACLPHCAIETAERIADRAQQRAAVLVAELDVACSRFRADSELNRLRHGTAEPVSPMLDAAVAAALRTARGTGGLVDPTVSAALVATGYDDDLEAVRARSIDADPVGVEARSPAQTPAAAPGYWRVVHDSSARRILVPHRVHLDLGASAKAWLADTIADRLRTEVITSAGAGVLVNLGGDIAVAGAAPAGGWRITIDDGIPARPDGRPVITIRGGGLATSSTTQRTWRLNGRDRHHIVDPRTGATAPTTWQAVTVAARSCELANAASTAAVVLGADAPAWLAGKGIHARLRHLDGSLTLVGAWPQESDGGAA